jgi:hypothetical protein
MIAHSLSLSSNPHAACLASWPAATAVTIAESWLEDSRLTMEAAGWSLPRSICCWSSSLNDYYCCCCCYLWVSNMTCLLISATVIAAS